MTAPDLSEHAGLGPLNYDDLPGLEAVYLEDSFVREIVECESFTSFTLLAALTPDHPQYEAPRPREQHSYRVATLTFPNVRAITWHARGGQAFTDADGALDYGNVDCFVADPRGFYHLEGEWGSVDITSDAPELRLHHPVTVDHRRRVEELAEWVRGQPSDQLHRH